MRGNGLKRVFFIQTDTGARRLTELDFPLSIGGGAADISLPDVAEAVTLAHIALADGHAYVQPASVKVELFHNHEYINTSAWLKSGDRIQIDEQIVCWDVKGDQVFIKVKANDAEPELKPPVMPPPGADVLAVDEQEPDPDQGQIEKLEPATVEIIPIATAQISPGKQRKLRILFFSLFTVLSLAALFVLFATPMSVNITPEPDTKSISGFPPPVSLGTKKMVVPGTFTVHATRVGYYPLEQSFEVKSDGFQAFEFELKELPGQLKINTVPEVPIKVSIEETELPIETGNILSLERGLQQLSIETDRYLIENREVNILGFGELQELSVSLRPAWADVRLETEPQGAELFVDDELVGTTPLEAEIVQGRREFELTLAGHKTFRFYETLKAGASRNFETFVLEPNDGILELTSQPVGATVSIDGVFHGSTPVSVVLKSGTSHQISLSKPGYLPASKTISLEADEERQLSLDLPAEFGIVFSSSKPADATLKLDGKPVGKGTQRLRLTTRVHELTFSKPGYVSRTLKVTPTKDTSQNVDVVLKTLLQAKEEARPQLLKTAGGQEMPLLEPSGNFQMGASRREAGRRANESQRLVEITKAYYLSSREVTNAEYRLFNSKHQSGSAEGVSLNADKIPVVNVSWDDAARFCNWLSEKDKLPAAYIEQDGKMKLSPTLTTGYRLPTEAEWVYAARVVNRSEQARYPWGEGYPPTTRAGNFADSEIADVLANVVTGYNDGYRGPAPVGSFPAQPSGFHDFGGNVAEWTNDFYAVYPGQSQRLVKDPMGPVSGDHHVVRGSSWRDGSITELRLSYRDYSRGPRDNLGFRIARYAD
jgi:formylglycine-generating enzyme required for sulfatase activity